VPHGKNPVSLNWSADTPFGTSLKFQVRTAGDEDAVEDSDWYGADGINSWFSKPGDINIPAGQYIQYRTRLITPNGAGTPYLKSVIISFE
jgi:hypothetical protein